MAFIGFESLAAVDAASSPLKADSFDLQLLVMSTSHVSWAAAGQILCR